MLGYGANPNYPVHPADNSQKRPSNDNKTSLALTLWSLNKEAPTHETIWVTVTVVDVGFQLMTERIEICQKLFIHQ